MTVRVWQSAADSFETAWHALAANKLPVEKLNIFNGSEMQRCSLACDELAKMDWVHHPGLATSFASVRSLSVSLSNRLVDDSDIYQAEDESDSGDEEGKDNEADEEEKGDGDEEDSRDTPNDEPTGPKRRARLRAEAEDKRNFVGLANFFQLCSQLDDFTLH